MIRGRGYACARVMLIADGGAESDVSTELAISGDPEIKLRKLAYSQGLDFEKFWLTCLIKEKITNKSGKDSLKKNRELLSTEYKEILNNEIQQIGSTVLVPLGEMAFNHCTGLQGIRKFRGSILPHNSIPGRRVIPILGPHPYLYEEPKLEFISRLDFSKVKRNENLDGPIPEIGQTWVAQTPGQVKSFFRRQLEKLPTFVVFDIETFANIPTCISFCFDGLESCCVPILDYHINEDDRILMLLAVAELLRSDIPKVNQNVKFDWR